MVIMEWVGIRLGNNPSRVSQLLQAVERRRREIAGVKAAARFQHFGDPDQASLKGINPKMRKYRQGEGEMECRIELDESK